MGVLLTRFRLVSLCLAERARYGLPEVAGPVDGDVLFILDGVGGFQFSPLVARRIIREQGAALGTIVCKWQFGVPGEIWSDLMWLRRNRLVAAKLARRILSFRREHPSARIHLLGYSGGAGVAAFACEQLRGRRIIETLILAAPALSSEYNLAPALRAVERGYALVSERDRWLLGVGTSLFGTIDRRRTLAAGRVGFRRPADLHAADAREYERLREIRWRPEFEADGNAGGHTGWLSLPYLHRHLLPLLRGTPDLITTPVDDAA